MCWWFRLEKCWTHKNTFKFIFKRFLICLFVVTIILAISVEPKFEFRWQTYQMNAIKKNIMSKQIYSMARWYGGWDSFLNFLYWFLVFSSRRCILLTYYSLSLSLKMFPKKKSKDRRIHRVFHENLNRHRTFKIP